MFGPRRAGLIFVEDPSGALRTSSRSFATPADREREDHPRHRRREIWRTRTLPRGRKPAKARELYDRAITPRTASIDPYYRRGLAALALDDPQSAVADFSRVVTEDPKYDFHRAAGLLAHVCGRLGHHDDAEAWFKQATALSTASELAIHYAEFLEQAQRPAEARQWAQRVLDKKVTMPGYLRRRERPWFRRAKAVLKRLRVGTSILGDDRLDLRILQVSPASPARSRCPHCAGTAASAVRDHGLRAQVAHVHRVLDDEPLQSPFAAARGKLAL